MENQEVKKQKYIFTEAHRKHLSEAHIGHPGGMFQRHHTEESRKKMAEKHIGLKHSEETKAKMAEKRRLYWQKKREEKKDE